MPRQRRHAASGVSFHATNRGVERRTLFRNESDYRQFLWLLEEGKQRYAVSLFALCLMPNHFHVIIRPDQDGALSAYFHWVQGCYSRHLRIYTHTSGYGHVFQERFWTGVIHDEWHFLNVLRYVEANPVTARLVKRAEQWQWSSLFLRGSDRRGLLDPLPVALARNWEDVVNDEPLADEPD
jgi:putative transposase